MAAKTNKKSVSKRPKLALLKKSVSFSKATVILFIVVFCLVGGYVIYEATHAATPEITLGYKGLCLDNYHNGTANGNTVDVWNCNGTGAQHWVKAGSRVMLDGKCLDDFAYKTNNGARVVLWTCDGGSNQNWYFRGAELVSSHAGKCLDDTGYGGRGTRVELYTCNNGSNQHWYTSFYGSTAPSSNSAYANPFRRVHVSRGRIDQGVDFGGSGPVYAVGAGRIVAVLSPSRAGWDGGYWINEQLSGGRARGKYVYIAEDCTPRVHVGQTVSTGTVVCDMYRGSTGIETGWAQAPSYGDIAMAHSYYYEGLATPFGINYSQLLGSLGGPTGNISLSSARSGRSLPSGWPRW